MHRPLLLSGGWPQRCTRTRGASVCSPQEAQRVATLCVLSLWKVCKDIVAKKVAATHMPREGCMSVHARLAKVAVDLNWFRGLHALCV